MCFLQFKLIFLLKRNQIKLAKLEKVKHTNAKLQSRYKSNEDPKQMSISNLGLLNLTESIPQDFNIQMLSSQSRCIWSQRKALSRISESSLPPLLEEIWVWEQLFSWLPLISHFEASLFCKNSCSPSIQSLKTHWSKTSISNSPTAIKWASSLSSLLRRRVLCNEKFCWTWWSCFSCNNNLNLTLSH